MKITRTLRIFTFLLMLFVVQTAVAQSGQADSNQVQKIDMKHAKECGPICAYFACRYYGLPATLEELSKLCKNTDKGSTLADVRNALVTKGLYAEGLRLTPDMLLANNRYFLILPVKEWGKGIDHFDVVMGSKGQQVLLLNYPSAPWFFPLRKLVKYWDGHALVVSNKPIDPRHFFSKGSNHSVSRLYTVVLIFIAAILSFMIAMNICKLLKNYKKHNAQNCQVIAT